jgi:hypothetical protein
MNPLNFGIGGRVSCRDLIDYTFMHASSVPPVRIVVMPRLQFGKRLELREPTCTPLPNVLRDDDDD